MIYSTCWTHQLKVVEEVTEEVMEVVEEVMEVEVTEAVTETDQAMTTIMMVMELLGGDTTMVIVRQTMC